MRILPLSDNLTVSVSFDIFLLYFVLTGLPTLELFVFAGRFRTALGDELIHE